MELKNGFLAEIENQLRDLVNAFPGAVGLVIDDLVSGHSLCINETKRFPAASLIKLPILWECFSQLESGRLSSEARILLTERDKVGGSGVLQALEAGLALTIQDLATLMIIASDNTATNLLIDLLGQARINAAIGDLGQRNTLLQRKMMDFASAGRGLDNVTTAADVAQLLSCFLGSDRLPAEARACILRILAQQQLNDRLSADWPEDVPFAHKTGSLPGVEHDAGILYPETRPLIVVILTQTDASNSGARLCREIGRLLYRTVIEPAR